MAYCKFCGLESNDSEKCQWCGRPLPPVPAAPAATPPPRPVEEKMAVTEEEERKGRHGFFIACGVLILLSTILLFINYHIYLWVMLGALFLAGILLAYFKIIPPFEDAWLEIVILVLLILFLPSFFALLGYIIYGLITRNMDIDIVWLLGTYAGMILILQIITFIAFPDKIPSSTIFVLRIAEFFSFVAFFLGWIVSSTVSPMNR